MVFHGYFRQANGKLTQNLCRVERTGFEKKKDMSAPFTSHSTLSPLFLTAQFWGLLLHFYCLSWEVLGSSRDALADLQGSIKLAVETAVLTPAQAEGLF